MNGREEIKKAYESILKGDFEQAIAWFEQAIALEPDNAAYYYRLSITCSRSNRLTRAIEYARIAVRLDPENESYQYHLHHLQARELVAKAEKCFEQEEDQYYLAVALLKEAVALDPLNAEAYLLLSIAHAELKDYSDAVRCVKEVLKLNPQHETANKLLQDYTNRFNDFLTNNRRRNERNR